MTRRNAGLVAVIALLCLIAGCGPTRIFSADVLQGVDRSFDFAKWRANPNADKGRKVELGGRIISGEPSESGTLLLVMQLPIVSRPVYGPVESKRRTGEFVVFFPGRLEDPVMTAGNRLIVVGTTDGAREVNVEGERRTTPYITAQCVHIWQTQGREIADFPDVGAGYYPLDEDTFCSTPSSP